MPPTLAYFLTWTTHGTWLPGDDRGWVHHGDGAAGRPYGSPDPQRERRARLRLEGEPVALDARQRRIVEDAIRDTCRTRGWPVWALNVRTNHVHVLLTAPQQSPERVMTSLKAWATRRLNEAGPSPTPGKLWTRHGSTRYIKSQATLGRAMEYVQNHCCPVIS